MNIVGADYTVVWAGHDNQCCGAEADFLKFRLLHPLVKLVKLNNEKMETRVGDVAGGISKWPELEKGKKKDRLRHTDDAV